MKFTGDDFPKQNQNDSNSSHGSELTDTIVGEHPKQLLTVAEQRIKAMHRHDDGTPVQLHEVGANELFSGPSLEGKLGSNATGKTDADESWQQQMQQAQNAGGSSEKIQYERSSKQGGLTYGRETAKFDNAAFASQNKGQETLMMGCNCGLEWTVTGVSMKKDSSDSGPGAIKIEQYGSADGKAAGYNVSGPGGERQKYNVSGSQQKDYKG